MAIIKSYDQFIKENDGGGGVAFATPAGNGMGNVIAPTVVSTPGSVWQSGSGTIGSGDLPAYDMGKSFQTIGKKKIKRKSKRRKKAKAKRKNDN